jgi:two-component system, OmpR family, sensor histidine kinase KdpD
LDTLRQRTLSVRFLASAAIVGAIIAFFSLVAPANVTTISLTFLLAVLGIAAAWGLAEAILTSVLAMIGINYFFLPPIGTLTVADPHNWVALGAFVITAISASHLSVSARRRAAEAEERRREIERLYALGEAMLLNSGLHSTAQGIVSQFVRIFDIPAAAFFSRAENEVFRSDPKALMITEEQLRRAADSEEPAIDAARGISVIPVRLGGQALGSLGIAGRTLSPGAVSAVAYLIAVGVERARALEEASRTEAARQSEVLKSALIDALAHDLKTPLTSIKGALTHLLGREHDAEEHELLSVANEEADRLHRLVVEVLEMARIEAGKLHPERRPEHIGEIVSASLLELEPLLKGRTVQVDIAHDLPSAAIDFEIIRQAVKQLVDNAARYSAPDTPITISAVYRDRSIVVSIGDQGIGIEDEERAAIFDKFFRGRNSRYQVPGTGLGLSIAKGIVEAHGGKIWVESEPGAGSMFRFSLPAIVEVGRNERSQDTDRG